MNSSLRTLIMLAILTTILSVVLARLPVTLERTSAAATREVEGIQAIAVVPNQNHLLYAGVSLANPPLHTVYRSDDTGRTWHELGARLPSRVTTIAAARDPEVLYLGTESMGVFKSLDGGKSWFSASLGLGPMPNATVTALGLDPQDDARLYATIGYWFGTSEPHFASLGTWVSTDAGASWAPFKG